MIIRIKNDWTLPAGTYNLDDERGKLERVRRELGPDATDRELILGYDREGGRLFLDGKYQDPGTFWKLETQRLHRLIDQFTEEELLYVVGRGPRFVLTEKCYESAKVELERRDRRKLIEATKDSSRIHISAGRDVINTTIGSKSSTVNIDNRSFTVKTQEGRWAFLKRRETILGLMGLLIMIVISMWPNQFIGAGEAIARWMVSRIFEPLQ